MDPLNPWLYVYLIPVPRLQDPYSVTSSDLYYFEVQVFYSPASLLQSLLANGYIHNSPHTS